MLRLSFSLEAEAPNSRARAGKLQTKHGEVLTPVFMPVGTQATVKNQTVESLKTSGSRILLANTYHLLLRPGPEVFRKFGGIHRFMNWDGPVLTDSGGFQIFSLPHSRSMNEEGARFQSYVDGSMHLLSPEESIRMQTAIGSDIMMALDQCISSTAEFNEAKAAMELTHRWAERSLNARGDSSQALFGIVQGACFENLRRESARFLTQLPFDGFAIGGLAVGETKQQRYEFTELTAQLLPRELPRYLMGVGTPSDILEAVHRGVDMFDCIMPSALSQQSVAFTSVGRLQLRRSIYKFSEDPVDPLCECTACRHYSRAYFHHLYKANEPLGWHLLAHHNLCFYHRLMREMREKILSGSFHTYYLRKREELSRTDNTSTATAPSKKHRRALKQTQQGDYEIHTSSKGFVSLRQKSSGEVMHPACAPMDEAERLYIQQSCLVDRLTLRVNTSQTRPLVIWDVGLGAATNAMAAVKCTESPLVTQRPLHILSFEKDLDPLRLALKNTAHFTHLRHAAPHALLEQGTWTRSGMRWDLLEGDFLKTMERAEALPDLIFYDPFSFKVDSELWSFETFLKIYQMTKSHPVELLTYSASTAVRGALLRAGFYVARGWSTGAKEETTVALTPSNTERLRYYEQSLLNTDWLEKRTLEGNISAHPQFHADLCFFGT